MLIPRKTYLEKLLAFKDKQIIKIVTGIRRCGKSTLLRMYRDLLPERGVLPEQIIAINFEDLDFEALTDYKNLYAYITARLCPDKTTYIFMDEIQHVVDFQKAVDSLYIKDNVDIYLTGSNAYMLSGEIATLISGRYVQIEMLPFSFLEYMQATDQAADSRNGCYIQYLQTGSFPYAVQLRDDPDALRDYLESLYHTIVIKDILARKKIGDPTMLKNVLRFVFDNIGNPISPKKTADVLSTNGRKIDTRTVEGYLEALCESYILYKAERYDIKGRQYLKTLNKYYVVDIGFRYFLLGSARADAGHILENIVYLELLRRGYRVYIGKADNLEIDFVALKANTTHYFQVALTIREPATAERELKPLKALRDNYPKTLLTMDDDPAADDNGIIIRNARDWLAETERTD